LQLIAIKLLIKTGSDGRMETNSWIPLD